MRHQQRTWQTPLVPAMLIVSAIFGVGIIALSAGPSVFVNRWVAALGQVSFSAYLIHFAILDLVRSFPVTAHTAATGYGAIGAFAVAWPFVLLVTYGLSSLTYRWIELLMINLGGRLIRQCQRQPVSVSW